MIDFNRPHLTGNELKYIQQAVVDNLKISGNGEFTKKCQHFFEERYGFKRCLLTTSCTDALEMAAILCDIQPGDEVIVPSYTFVSSALADVAENRSSRFLCIEKNLSLRNWYASSSTTLNFFDIILKALTGSMLYET